MNTVVTVVPTSSANVVVPTSTANVKPQVSIKVLPRRSARLMKAWIKVLKKEEISLDFFMGHIWFPHSFPAMKKSLGGG